MDELTRAVFDAVYRSAAQRVLRLLFGGLLVLKHILRGFAFSWPLYMLSLAGLALPGDYVWLFYLLLVPALMVSGSILLLGLSEEYSDTVQGRILKMHEWKRIVLGREG